MGRNLLILDIDRYWIGNNPISQLISSTGKIADNHTLYFKKKEIQHP
jgi:hypothetical protein